MSQAALGAVEQRITQRHAIYDEFAEVLLAVEQSISEVVQQQMHIFGSAGRL
jgi:fructose-bisphosphate aldolase class II